VFECVRARVCVCVRKERGVNRIERKIIFDVLKRERENKIHED